MLQDAEIRHLAALAAVASERSFGSASRRLGCARSTLTRQLDELERFAGARLLERGRGGRSTGLTDAGRLLLDHAQAVLARVQAARADVEALARGESLRIGVCASVEAPVLQAVLSAQQAASIIAAADDLELARLVERGDVDLSLLTLPLPPGAFGFVKLLDEPYALLVPARSELADRPATPPPITVPLVARRPAGRESHAEHALAAAGWRFEIVRRVASDAAARALVAAGVGASILPRSSVDVGDSATVAIELDRTLPRRTIALAWQRYRRLTPTAERFRQAALEACGAPRDVSA